MGRKFKVWLDSGANAHSCYEQEIDIEDCGITGVEWDEMTEQEKDDFMKEIAWDRMDWGWAELEND